MKKSLLLLFAFVAMSLSAQRAETPAQCMAQLKQTIAVSPRAKAARAALAAKRVSGPSITPAGTPVYYEMSAWMAFEMGLEYIEGMANTLYFDEDGTTVYLGSLFPSNFLPNDLWAKGTIEGNQLTIDSKEPVFSVDMGDDDVENLYIGEVYFYEYYGEWYYGGKDIVMTKDGDHFYIDDDKNNPTRQFILYVQDAYGDVEPIDLMYCYDLKPYTGNTEKAIAPESATVSDYIYYSLDTYGDKTAHKGSVAIDGDNYYLDFLIPNISPAVVKGQRNGNTLTIPAGQFMTADMGYYLYFSGFAPTSFDEANGQYLGEPCDLTFTIGEDGTLTLDNPTKTFVTALQNDGQQYDCVYENSVVPYAGDVPAVPSKPTGVEWVADYVSGSGVYFDFVQTNLSEEGEYLNPEKLGYYIYLDGEKYTFKRSLYGAIAEEEMTLMPFGYTDAYGYDIYSAGTWNEIYFYIDTFETLGVQAVYTVNGETRTSSIVTIDQNGEISEIDGIAPVEAAPISRATWYDLAGRKATSATTLRLTSGRKQIR